MITDNIVFSMKDKHIQERLLREVKLTPNRAMDICKSSELSRKELQGPDESTKVVSKSRVKHKPKHGIAMNQHKKPKA